MSRILKQDAERFLANVPDDNVFRCYDGRTFRNIEELGQAFRNMGDESFTHHVNTGKNNFSNWVKDVINDEKLARDLAKSQNQSQAAKAAVDRMSFLSNKLKPS